MIPHWLHHLIGSRIRSKLQRSVASRPVRHSSRPALDMLEDRTLLSFAAPVAFDLAAPPSAVAVGRFEGANAPLDVVTANANGTVSVLLGRGDGTLQNPIDITTGAAPSAVAVGDILGNGLQDIVVGNTN